MTNKELSEQIKEIDKEAMIERFLGRNDKARILETCSFSLRRELKDKTNDN